MKALPLYLLLFFSVPAFSNVAQPGIWDAGGAGAFFLLHPEDSLAFQKIQMVQELVKIQLYPGVAVVKGVYQMHNPTGDTLVLRVGYPLNAYYDPSDTYNLMQISFDDLYDLRVRVRGKPVKVALDSMDVSGFGLEDASEWYVWENRFLPGEITTLEVQFMVNTNDATVLRGYDRGKFNAFIYLLESGSTWKQPIGKGAVMIQLMGGLTLEDIQGVGPAGRFLVDSARNILVWKFENLSPTSEDNPVITYGKRIEDFSFEKVLLEIDKVYYPAIEAMNHQEILASDLKPYEFGDPFDPGTRKGSWLFGTYFFLVAFGIPLLLIIVGIWLGIFLYRRYKAKRGFISRKNKDR